MTTHHIGLALCSRCGGSDPNCNVCHEVPEEFPESTTTYLNDLRIHVRYHVNKAQRNHEREVRVIKALGGRAMAYKLEIAEAAFKRDMKAIAPKQRELDRLEELQ